MTRVEHPTVRQERDDMPAWAVYGFAGSLVFLLVLGAAITWIAKWGAPVRVGWHQESVQVPEAPREMQGIDLTLFGAQLPSIGRWDAKRQELSEYGWIDRQKGLVRIPVERAMDILVERGHVE